MSEENPTTPNAFTPSPPQDDASLLQGIRENLISRLFVGLFWLVLIALPLSLSRSVQTGWLPMYSAHLAIGGTMLLAFWQRKRLSLNLKVSIILALFWSVGLFGLVSIGLLGAGIWWLVMSALLAGVLVSQQAGVITLLLTIIALCLAGLAFVTGALQLGFDANTYISAPSAWLTLLVGTAVMPFIVFQAIAAYHQATLRLLSELNEQKRLVEYLASHDPLTGLHSMHQAEAAFKQATREQRKESAHTALLFIDLDDLKPVNDQFGHAAGDHALRAIGERMHQHARPNDRLIRKGGDEFIAILPGVTDATDAQQIAERLRQAINTPIQYGGQILHLSASIGIAMTSGSSTALQEMLAKADEAMYRAKQAGKNRIELAEAGLWGGKQ